MSDFQYPHVEMLINGEWTHDRAGSTQDVINPATGAVIGKVPHASASDLDKALEGAQRGFEEWRATTPHVRYQTMRQIAAILRERAPDIAQIMTLEQGKPTAEALAETNLAADILDWFAEEARRLSDRQVPARVPERVSQW